MKSTSLTLRISGLPTSPKFGSLAVLQAAAGPSPAFAVGAVSGRDPVASALLTPAARTGSVGSEGSIMGSPHDLFKIVR